MGEEEEEEIEDSFIIYDIRNHKKRK